MQEKKILGFSGRMLSGKGVLANAMKEEYDADIVTVAGALKELICGMRPELIPSVADLNRLKREGVVFDSDITEDDIRFISQETGVPYENVKTSFGEKNTWRDVRDMMQTIGTNIIRAYNPNWHVEKLKENIMRSNAPMVCVDDVRFPNERTAVEELGGECFFIIRPQSEVLSNHESETSIVWQEFDEDHVIINDDSEWRMVWNFMRLIDNDFNIPCECPILLSFNDAYLNSRFDFGTEEYMNTPIGRTYGAFILEDLIKQNENNDAFRKHGIITYRPKTFGEGVEVAYRDFLREVLAYSYTGQTKCSQISFYNPLIYENLKRHLKSV